MNYKRSLCIYCRYLSILFLLMVSCKSDIDAIDEDDPQKEGNGPMTWIANIELDTKTTDDGTQEHYIYFPPEDCEYVFKCTNYKEIRIHRGMLGFHTNDAGMPDTNCWLSFKTGEPEYEQSDPDSRFIYCYTPYYRAEINGNTFKISLKGSKIYPVFCCTLRFSFKGDDTHHDRFYFAPKTEQ